MSKNFHITQFILINFRVKNVYIYVFLVFGLGVYFENFQNKK
jgi:hypothetical protein